MKRYKIYILLLCLVFVCGGCTRRVPATTATTEGTTEQVQKEQETFTGVIQAIDQLQNTMTFVDVRTEQVYTLAYHGGVDVTNKYGDIMAISQLSIGEIVDAAYDVEKEKLMELHVNETAIRYEGVQNIQIDAYNKTVKAAGTSLTYTDQVVVYDGSKSIEITALTDQDQVNLWEFDGKLCSAVVVLGHGYLRFQNYDTYKGGMIEVGDVIVPVTEDMLLTVQEGEYELRITKGKHTGTRYVTVTRDVETNVDLKALQIVPDPTGAAVIAVKPEGCKPTIYIDGIKYEENKEIELVYGRHLIRIYADGYQRYSGYLEIEQAYKKYEYTLQSENGSSTESTEAGSKEPSESTDSTEATTQANTGEGGTTTEASTVDDITNHKITILAPVAVKLYVDGKYVGETPCSFTKTAGSHIITLTCEGCVAATYTITAVDNGKDDSYSFDALESFGNALDYWQ